MTDEHDKRPDDEYERAEAERAVTHAARPQRVGRGGARGVEAMTAEELSAVERAMNLARAAGKAEGVREERAEITRMLEAKKAYAFGRAKEEAENASAGRPGPLVDWSLANHWRAQADAYSDALSAMRAGAALYDIERGDHAASAPAASAESTATGDVSTETARPKR
jgi:hypothetical protein